MTTPASASTVAPPRSRFSDAMNFAGVVLFATILSVIALHVISADVHHTEKVPDPGEIETLAGHETVVPVPTARLARPLRVRVSHGNADAFANIVARDVVAHGGLYVSERHGRMVFQVSNSYLERLSPLMDRENHEAYRSWPPSHLGEITSNHQATNEVRMSVVASSVEYDTDEWFWPVAITVAVMGVVGAVAIFMVRWRRTGT